MNKRIIAFVSIVLTILVVVLAATLIRDVAANKAADVSPEVINQFIQREEIYNETIKEANQRIETLNAELAEAQKTNDEESPVQITPEQAALIALQTTNYQDSLQSLPELVDFEGVVSFEIQMSNGTVYVDARTGDVLFNGVPEKIDMDQAAVIAGEYLGGLDPRYSLVKETILNGSKVFQVSIGNYVVMLDQFGTVLQAQAFEYTEVSTSSSSSSTSNSSSVSSNHGDDDDDDDDDYEDEEDEEDEEDHD